MPTAKLTRQARARMLTDCDMLEIHGQGVAADLFRALLAESERADAALEKAEALEDRVRWLEGVVESLGNRVAEQDAVLSPVTLTGSN